MRNLVLTFGILGVLIVACPICVMADRIHQLQAEKQKLHEDYCGLLKMYLEEIHFFSGR